MEEKEFIRQVKEAVPASIHNPDFYPQLFSWMSQVESEEPILMQFDRLSRSMNRGGEIQEGASARNLFVTRALARELIDDEGKLLLDRLKRTIQLLEQNLYPIGPGRQNDGRRREHILHVLKQLDEDEETRALLDRISKPFRHPQGEEVIRDTLGLDASISLSDAHARRAALSAWLTYLRQNVGSCFGTAPAIMIYREQSKRFLRNIDELLNTGRLVRTFGGEEYAVPMSPSWGVGDILRTFLISTDPASCTPIWESPGIEAALKAARVLEETPIEEVCRRTIEGVLAGRELGLITVDRFLREVLLMHLDLSKEDIDEFTQRPRPLMKTQLVAHVTMPAKGASKDQRIQVYQSSLVAASKAFKAFTDNALLKVWEFTIASLSETKHDFSTWNLYASLGMAPDDVNGIGGKLYEILSQKVDEYNNEVHRMQEEIEPIYNHVKLLEVRMRRASSEDEAKWVQSEYRARVNEMRTYEEMRDTARQKAQLFSQLFDFLVDQYMGRFKDYFQELYDADMHDVKAGPYDDSPAGFRLLYKAGRSITSAWTMIRSPAEFVEAISGFFIATENELSSLDELTLISDEVSYIINQLVMHLRSPEFLETAFHRMAKAHGIRPIARPLEHLDQIEKKPWAYTSGGTMNQLISCYNHRTDKPSQESRWVDDAAELAVFLLDICKKLPDSAQIQLDENPDLSLLMHSPTHAFLLKPGWPDFAKGWRNDVYTYTWVKQHWISPNIQRWSNYRMDGAAIRLLYEQLVNRVPEGQRELFERSFAKLPNSATPREFREYMVLRLQKEAELKVGGRWLISEEDLDAVLYESLPVIEKDRIPYQLRKLLDHAELCKEEELETLIELYEEFFSGGPPERITSEQLLRIAKSLLLIHTKRAFSPVNVHRILARSAAEVGLAMPQPILFADTNWVTDYFAFVFNPGTEQLEFWRCDEVGRKAVPMHQWKHWLDGSRKKPEWGVLNRPEEYWRF